MKKYWLFFSIILLILSSCACSNESENIQVEQETDWLPDYSSDDQETEESHGIPGLDPTVVQEDENVLSENTEVKLETDWLAEYSSYVQETMEGDGIPGLALAVVQGDEIVFAEGYGLRDVDMNKPVTTGTLFHIGSTQKSMTAMMIATLVDDGLLDWDEPVINFAPSFGLSDPQAMQEVTIRHLLSMRGGIPDDAEDDLNEEAGDSHSIRELRF